MPDVDSYAHGIPSWIDLATPDPEASKSFYAALFGWDYDHEDTDQPGVPYIMCRIRGRAVAGMMLLSPQMAESGMPPVWTTYLNVDDLDAATAKVTPAGGSVLQAPMEVMEAGRMAVVADPSGAVFCLWQKKEHVGAEVVNEHGALSWNELITPDPAQVAPFYQEVVGWTAQTAPMPMGDYTVFFVEGGNPNGIAGAMATPMEGMPTFWGVYFAVGDCDAAVATAVGMGATVMAEPMDLEGVGRMAALVDPQGATFSVMQMAEPQG